MPTDDSAILGARIDRVDGLPKVTGDAPYSIDQACPGMAWGYLVTSEIAAGRLDAVDLSEAKAAPGVIAVFTPFDPLPIKPVPSLTNPSGPRYAPLMDPVVRHYGQVVALVVAESFEQAREAAARVRPSYQCEQAEVSLDVSGRDSVPAQVDHGQDADTGYAPDGEDVQQILARSEVVVSGTYRTAAQNHVAMEPHNALAWWSDDGRLHLRTGHQSLPWLVGELAATFDLPPDDIDVVATYIGGGFGGKTRAGVDVKLACAAARVLGRPIKIVLTRRQVFTTTVIRAMTEQHVVLGADRDGRLTAIEHRSRSGESALISDLLMAPGHATTRMLYRTDAMSVSQRRVTLNLPRTGFMRGPAEVPGLFAIETAMDELADRLGMDPVELRLRNDAATYPGLDVPWSSKRLAECLRLGAKRFGWAERSRRPRSRVDGDDYVGLGVAATVYRAAQISPVVVEVTLHADGTVEVATSAVDLGTGMVTVIAMSAADALAVPVERIVVRHGNSALPAGGAALGSTGTASVAPAVHAAARSAMAELRDRAAGERDSPFQGIPAEKIEVYAGTLSHASTTIGFAQLLTALGQPALTSRGQTQPRGPVHDGRAHWSFGAQFCEVRLNRWTLEPRVRRMLGVMDIGRVVNRKTAESQIMGGMIWGMSTALFEGLEFDSTGVISNASLADYLVPVNADVPAAEVVLLDIPDYSHNELGIRGAGEIGAGGMTAAVGNAIYNAVGIRLRSLPMTVDQLMTADGAP
ncbi:xanthine dehydrogenase family protein molybdopterin-binding subunit [Dactylosporangium sp. CA-233914]|uniref:xanthine dehydrogenase family protein molybdopterin-binding subunit n=1 Tax=Dactylosporangium sp. CA-233914 TaxID=3239934 RepID=UPI003D8EC260